LSPSTRFPGANDSATVIALSVDLSALIVYESHWLPEWLKSSTTILLLIRQIAQHLELSQQFQSITDWKRCSWQYQLIFIVGPLWVLEKASSHGSRKLLQGVYHHISDEEASSLSPKLFHVYCFSMRLSCGLIFIYFKKHDLIGIL
jgi:hypothetical protein